ncbi:MAG: hypothetical protein FWE27_01810 [Defluviitaleaceae bacterium]|nr:hypothetical protein [Defluviitaleaceae bacterium]
MSDEQNQNRVVDTLHNQDKVLKESLSLFTGGSLEFLDEELSGEVTDILSTEITETTTKKAYGDKALKLSTNMGIHSECEAHISKDDMIRFASYNLDLTRLHKIPFTTVIITTKKPSVTSYTCPSLSFTPKIINLKERDADKVLAEIDKKLKAGEQSKINLLEVVYLPLYGSESGKTTFELLNTAIKLTPIVSENKHTQHKLQDLLILLTSTFISEEEQNRIWEENMPTLENNPAIRMLEERSMNKKMIEIAKNMLRDGDDVSKVSRNTGLDLSRVAELQTELQAAAV